MKEEDSITIIQEKIDEFINNHGGYWPPLSMLAAIVEEVGELAREINHLERYKPKKADKTDMRSLGEELGDIVFSVICLANFYDIKLNEEILQVLKKYQKRDSNRFV